MKRPCASCSQDVFFTFLEAVTGIQKSRNLVLGSHQYIRALSTTYPTRLNVLEPNTYGNTSISDEGTDLIPDHKRTVKVKPASSTSSLKRSTIDTKSWKSQRRRLFEDTNSADEKLESGTITGVDTHRTVNPLLQDDRSASAIGSPVSVEEYSNSRIAFKKAGKSKLKQDLGYEELYSGALSGQSSIIHKKDKWHNRPLQIQSQNESQSHTGGVSNAVLAEQSTQDSSAPRKKDRWRNRVAVVDATKTAQMGNDVLGSRFAGDDQVHARQSQTPASQQPIGKSENTPLASNRLQARSSTSPKDLPAWKAHKFAVKTKLDGNEWRPLKRLSPDAREGVRQLHNEDPVLWSTEHLANHFQISADAIRRILKSNWKPTEREREEQQERWIRRGETIWDRYVELGRKAPRKWRGLNPMPATKLRDASDKTEFKPEEWNQDPIMDADETTGLGPDLGNRIL